MRLTRHILGVAALTLGATLAACSDSGTAPQAGSDNPLVAELNRLANGQGTVLNVRNEEKVIRGEPAPRAGVLKPSLALQPCYPDDYECPPIDRTCYYSCAWFDVATGINTGYNYWGSKYADLWGELYAYTNTDYADVYISFRSAGGCANNPSQFDYSYFSGNNGPFTLSTYRWIEYSTGTFTWAVSADGYATNRYGREGYESSYTSTCF